MNSEAFNILNNESNKKIIQTQEKSTLIVCGYTDLNFSHESDATIKVILRDKSSGDYLIAYKVPVKSLGLLPIGTEIYKNEPKYREFKEIEIKHNFYSFKAYKFDELSQKEKDAVLKSIYGDITKWSNGKFVVKEPYFYVFPQNKDVIIIIPDFLLLIPFYFPDDIINNITTGFKRLRDYIYSVNCNNKALLLKKHVPESSKQSIVLLCLYACYEEAIKRQKGIFAYHIKNRQKTAQSEEIELEQKYAEDKEMEFYYKFPFNMETKYIIEGEYVDNIFVAYRIHPIDFGIKVYYRYPATGKYNNPIIPFDRYFGVKKANDIELKGIDKDYSLKSGIEDRDFVNMGVYKYIGPLEKLEPEKKQTNHTNDSLIPKIENSNEEIGKGGFNFEKRKGGDAVRINSVRNDNIDGLIDALRKYKGIKNFVDLGSWRECRAVCFVYKNKYVLVVFPAIKDSGSYIFSSTSFDFKNSFRWIIKEILKIRKRLSRFRNLDEFRESKALNERNIIFHPTQKYVGSIEKWIERLLEKVDKDRK